MSIETHRSIATNMFNPIINNMHTGDTHMAGSHTGDTHMAGSHTGDTHMAGSHTGDTHMAGSHTGDTNMTNIPTMRTLAMVGVNADDTPIVTTITILLRALHAAGHFDNRQYTELINELQHVVDANISTIVDRNVLTIDDHTNAVIQLSHTQHNNIPFAVFEIFRELYLRAAFMFNLDEPIFRRFLDSVNFTNGIYEHRQNQWINFLNMIINMIIRNSSALRYYMNTINHSEQLVSQQSVLYSHLNTELIAEADDDDDGGDGAGGDFYLNDASHQQISFRVQHFLNSLPIIHSNDDCSICIEQIGEGVMLPCAHIFHETCIGRWFIESRLHCPLCRNNSMAIDE